MVESGTKAISVDQKNDVAETRKKVGPKTLVFGNYDPYNVLVAGTPDLVRTTIKKCMDDGVSAGGAVRAQPYERLKNVMHHFCIVRVEQRDELG